MFRFYEIDFVEKKLKQKKQFWLSFMGFYEFLELNIVGSIGQPRC
jgi:hypothetical protein